MVVVGGVCRFMPQDKSTTTATSKREAYADDALPFNMDFVRGIFASVCVCVRRICVFLKKKIFFRCVECSVLSIVIRNIVVAQFSPHFSLSRPVTININETRFVCSGFDHKN